MKYNPYLLQEDEVANADAYLTADASKIYKDNDGMKFSVK